MASHSVIYFPKQSKSASSQKKTPKQKEKATVLEWIRNGYHFPGIPLPPIPEPRPKPPKPDDPPEKKIRGIKPIRISEEVRQYARGLEGEA